MQRLHELKAVVLTLRDLVISSDEEQHMIEGKINIMRYYQKSAEVIVGRREAIKQRTVEAFTESRRTECQSMVNEVHKVYFKTKQRKKKMQATCMRLCRKQKVKFRSRLSREMQPHPFTKPTLK